MAENIGSFDFQNHDKLPEITLPDYLEEVDTDEIFTQQETEDMNKEQGDDVPKVKRLKKRKKTKSKQPQRNLAIKKDERDFHKTLQFIDGLDSEMTHFNHTQIAKSPVINYPKYDLISESLDRNTTQLKKHNSLNQELNNQKSTIIGSETQRAPFLNNNFEYAISRNKNDLKSKVFMNRTSMDDLRREYFKQGLLSTKHDIQRSQSKNSVRNSESSIPEIKHFFRSDSKEPKTEAGGVNPQTSHIVKFSSKSNFLETKMNEVEERFNEQYSELEDTLYQENLHAREPSAQKMDKITKKQISVLKKQFDCLNIELSNIQEKRFLKSSELSKIQSSSRKLNTLLDKVLGKIESIQEDIQNDEKLLSMHLSNVCMYQDEPTEAYLKATLDHISKQISLESKYINLKLEMRKNIERHKMNQIIQIMSIVVEPIHDILQPPSLKLKTHLAEYRKRCEILELELMSECSKHIVNESKQPIDKSLQAKFQKLNDKLVGLRREKKELIRVLNRIRDVECIQQDSCVIELANLCRTELKLKEKLITLRYHKNKLDYCKEILRQRNGDVDKLKAAVNKKSLQINLPYTYKKRFNEIVQNNQNDSNYPKARTSASQEVTIGNVLDYLDRVVDEKNTLKQEIKTLKKQKKKISRNMKLTYNKSNPKTLKNTQKFSEAEDSDVSANDLMKKTFDKCDNVKDIRDATSVMLQGKINFTYKNLLQKGKKKLKRVSTKENFITEDDAKKIMNSFCNSGIKKVKNSSRNLYNRSIRSTESLKSLGSFKMVKKTNCYDKVFNRRLSKKSVKAPSLPVSSSASQTSKPKITPTVAKISLISHPN
ncbi:unnamed protein product [Moneuplotes crassus]|uniref:Uncharacterized protein n=1 Tax=Euplotes crassus TaxID=5936 RepID=A0AAD2D5G0_EUPCR|nr:unnamed protein product [Moneuplotes crassus]